MPAHEHAQTGAGRPARLFGELETQAREGDGVVLADGARFFLAEDLVEVEVTQWDERRRGTSCGRSACRARSTPTARLGIPHAHRPRACIDRRERFPQPPAGRRASRWVASSSIAISVWRSAGRWASHAGGLPSRCGNSP